MNEEKELPQGWCWASLEELAYRIGDVDHKMPKPVDLGIPYISTKNFYGRDNIDFDTAKQISYEDYMALSRKIKPEMGDILLSRYGTVGEVRKVSTDMDFQASYSIAIIKTLPIPMITNYLVFALRSEIVQAQIKRDTRATAQPDLGLEHIRHFEIPLAPLAAQQRIIAAIEERFTILDAVATALQQNKQKLKLARASVLKHAVEGKLTEKWRAEHPATESGLELLERILAERCAKWEAQQLAKGKDPRKLRYEEPNGPDVSELPELSEGWCWATVEQVSYFVRYGTSAKTSEDPSGVPVLRMGNIQDGELDISNLKYLPVDHPEFPDLLLQDGDLLFNRTNSAELVGKSAVYRSKFDQCSYASYLISVRTVTECLTDYLCFFLNSSYGKAWVASVVTQQVGQANVNGTKLQNLVFPLPSFAEQQQIFAEVERHLSVIEQAEAAIETSLKRIERARQSILEMAFSGRLVPQDPHDEPASVLLERIQEERARRVVEGKLRGKNGGIKAARVRKTKEEDFVPQWQLLKDAQQPGSIDGALGNASADEDGASERREVGQGEIGKEELESLVQMPLLSLWD